MDKVKELKSKDSLIIIGASGHGKVIADIALRMKRWQEIYFLDDKENIGSTMGIEVIGKSTEALNYINDFDMFVAIGNNFTREKIQSTLEASGASIPSLIHPGAVIGNEVEIGTGTAIMAGVVINCCSIIGKGCIVNSSSTIDHDNIINDYVHISPGAHLAGTVEIGRNTWLGIGSVVSNNLKITSDCVIGAGAVVIKDIIQSGTYIGVPAKRTNE